MANSKKIDISDLSANIVTEQAAATSKHAALSASTPCPELLREILRLKKEKPAENDVEARLQKKIKGNPNRAQRVGEFINLITEISEKCEHPLNVLHGGINYYNGKFWEAIAGDDHKIEYLFGELATALGVEEYEAKYCDFVKKVKDSFFVANRICAAPLADGCKMLNCQNGTVEIIQAGKPRLREHRPEDCLQYVLPYSYDPKATCPKFDAFLRDVLPLEPDRLNLQEYIGSCFSDINHEKIAYLYGATGKNGKTTCKDIICAMLGEKNVTHTSLAKLTDEKTNNGAAARMALEGKLLNACGEVGKEIEDSDNFKKLASREPLSERVLYTSIQRTIPAGSYARLLFCCNRLPKFKQRASSPEARRLLFIEFAKEIPANKVNTNLAKEIIAEELPGILNWAIDGLLRLSKQGGAFTENPHAEFVKDAFILENNNVAAWLSDCGYVPLTMENRRNFPKAEIICETGKNLYGKKDSFDENVYCIWCEANGRVKMGRSEFDNTLRNLGYKDNGRNAARTRCFQLLKLSDEEREQRNNPEQTIFGDGNE